MGWAVSSVDHFESAQHALCETSSFMWRRIVFDSATVILASRKRLLQVYESWFNLVFARGLNQRRGEACQLDSRWIGSLMMNERGTDLTA